MEQSTKLNPITGSSEPNASHMFSPDMWHLVVASMGARHHNHTIFYHFNFLILFPYHILYSDFQCQRGSPTAPKLSFYQSTIWLVRQQGCHKKPVCGFIRLSF
jgi:hypothetical protein